MSAVRSVAVVGGGRWARVMVDVLAGLSRDLDVSIHSPSSAADAADWAKKKGLRLRAETSGPDYRGAKPDAAIVANRVGDHMRAATAALDAGVPVLVEKPLAPTAAEAEALAARGGKLAASQVFMFSRPIESLAAAIRAAGRLEKLDVVWSDPAGNVRHGQAVRYDPQAPLHVDVLPHLCAIAAALTGKAPEAVRAVKSSGEGRIETELVLGTALLTARLERNSDARRRVVTALAGGRSIRLDVSTEPGTLDGKNADPLWEKQPRPMAAMLSSFLEWAGGGPKDPRLDPAVGVQACRLADEIGALLKR